MYKNLKRNKGFTLIELLIVIGIIAILAAAVIITITPGERLFEARESTRLSHMSAVGTAFHVTVVEDEDFVSIYNILDSAAGCNFTDADTVFNSFNDTCAQAIGLTSAPVDPEDNTSLYRVKATSTTTASNLEIQPAAGVTSNIGIKVY